MEVQKFKEELQKVNGLSIGDYIVFNDYELYNLKTNQEKKFDSFDELLKHKIRGITIENIIGNIDEITFNLAGGRGAGGQAKAGSLFAGQHEGLKGGRSDYDLSSKMNKMYGGNKQTFDNTLRNFKNTHLLDDSESAVAIDNDGFVSVYKHGGKNSVGFGDGELAGKHIIHNHPSGSNFSRADLITTATTKATGVTASGKYYDYILKKTSKFDAKGFIKAVNNANGSTGDYNEDVHKFLKSNAKKYGYKYSRRSNSKFTSKLDNKLGNIPQF